MKRVSVRCPAKVNLYLRVLAREDSGYHQIETLFQGVALYDRLEMEVAEEGVHLELDVGPEAPLDAESNTVTRAARMFFRTTGIDGGVRARLVKGIPAGTGLGGGSSDAAGALLGLNRLYGEPLGSGDLIALAGQVGADVPFFCNGFPTAFAWGRGDRLLPQTAPDEAHVVICIPAVRISTEGAYRTLSKTLDRPLSATSFGPDPSLNWERLNALQHNDFESVVFKEHESLAALRRKLEDAGALVARMTGSGSAVFGVFDGLGEARRVSGEVARSPGVERVFLASTLTSGPLNPVE